jgi:hypothetical protein
VAEELGEIACYSSEKTIPHRFFRFVRTCLVGFSNVAVLHLSEVIEDERRRMVVPGGEGNDGSGI